MREEGVGSSKMWDSGVERIGAVVWGFERAISFVHMLLKELCLMVG